MNNVKRGRVNREKRRASAQQRVNMGTRSPEDQIKALDERLGVGVGAAKEREELQRQITPKRSKKVKS